MLAFALLTLAAAAGDARPGTSWTDRITFEGLADAYYAHRINGSEQSGRPRGERGGPSELRAFDATNDAFQVAHAKLAVAMDTRPAGLRLDLAFGPVAEGLRSGTDPQSGLVDTTANEIWKHVQQAYASFVLPWRGIGVDVGRFVSGMGAEAIDARSNWCYSRSLLFTHGIPLTYTGLRATAPLWDGLTLDGVLANGWDQPTDVNKYKSGGLGFTWAAPFGTTFRGQVFASSEVSLYSGIRLVESLVISHPLGALELKLDLLHGFETFLNANDQGDAAAWYGAALYASYPVTRWLRASGRAEVLVDALGARTLIQNLSRPDRPGPALAEVTLTAAVPVGGQVELRAEARHDRSLDAEDRIFRSDTATPQTSQTTVSVAALAWF
jgi:hypothetical protein